MPAVEKYREVPGMIERRDKLSEEIAQLEHQLYMSKRRHRYLNRDINDAKNAVNGTSSSGEEKKEAKKFIRQCPCNDCNGYLSTQWKCGVCKIWACPKCFEAIGFDKNAEHTCDPSAVASAELIKKETKPCPSCGTRIFKINGCDQMWCTSCKVAFFLENRKKSKWRYPQSTLLCFSTNGKFSSSKKSGCGCLWWSA